MTTSELRLSPAEAEICTLLDRTCRWIQQERPRLPAELGPTPALEQARWACEARIAGGWVRDKVLQLPSDDMDVCLSTLTGYQFAHYVRLYLAHASPHASPSAPRSSTPERGTMGSITKIEANPLLGKNLETATAKLLGQSLDFVQLRGPVPGASKFGTPKEDAERRDLTINALFYNVHTARVEDETGMGLEDLQQGRIRTPLPPGETFSEDPLRILRSIRFACRFGFSLHDDLRAAVRSGEQAERLRLELGSKVSRERFGTEVDKMLRSPHPALALETLHDLCLFPLVFRPPPEEDGTPSVLYAGDPPVPAAPRYDDKVAVEMGWALEQCWRSASSSSDARVQILSDSEQRRRLFYALALFPLDGLRARSHPLATKSGQKPKRSLLPAGDVVLVDGLRTGVKVTKDPVEALYLAVRALREFKAYEEGQDDLASKQTKLYFLLRRPYFSRSAMGITPKAAFLFASLVRDYMGLSQNDLDRWWSWIERKNMLARAEERPLLNGKQIEEIAGFPPGPLIPRMQDKILQWQFWHGEQPDADQKAREWFAQAWNEGQIIPSDEVERAREAAVSKTKGKKRPRS